MTKVSVGEKFKEEMFDSLFDELITTSCLTEDISLSDKLKITLKTLSSREALDAESVYVATLSNVPYDVVLKARVISTLVHATKALNGIDIDTSNQEQLKSVRANLYKKYMDLPPGIVDRMRHTYNNLVQKQNDLYKDLDKNLENFSVAPGEE